MKTKTISFILFVSALFAIIVKASFVKRIILWMLRAILSGLFYELVKWLLGF